MLYVIPLLALPLAVIAAGGPLLNLSYAQYEGVYDAVADMNNFLGIRYAQAPVGSLRWMPPQDIEQNNNFSSLGAINATVYGPECVQGIPYWSGVNNTFAEPPAGSEDCLILNVQVPAYPKSNKLPILFYIHGGGYTEGNNQISPEALMVQSNGAFVFVSTQYRLGAYGFLAGAEVQQNGVANAGLLDQRAAMMWALRNAAAFGGDPARMVITGGSAGGGSVACQMILFRGENAPFQGVIAEYPWLQPLHAPAVLEAQYDFLLSAAGCNDIACLRGLSETDLATATQQVYINSYTSTTHGYGYGDFYFGPTVDGEAIYDVPSHEFKSGHFAKVPLLVNRDGYEGVLFSNISMNSSDLEVADLKAVFPLATTSFIDRLYELYPQSAFNSTFYRRAQWYGDFIIECPTYYMAGAVADAGLPSYKMLFYAGSEEHAAVDFFTINTLPANESYGFNNDTIGVYVKDWFLSFLTHSDPNAVSYSGVQKPYWPSYENGTSFNFPTMQVNYTQIGVVRDWDASPQCDFWRSQSYIVRN